MGHRGCASPHVWCRHPVRIWWCQEPRIPQGKRPQTICALLFAFLRSNICDVNYSATRPDAARMCCLLAEVVLHRILNFFFTVGVFFTPSPIACSKCSPWNYKPGHSIQTCIYLSCFANNRGNHPKPQLTMVCWVAMHKCNMLWNEHWECLFTFLWGVFLMQLLKALQKYNPVAYFNGHDHFLACKRPQTLWDSTVHSLHSC